MLFLASHKDITSTKMAEMSLTDECDSGESAFFHFCPCFIKYLSTQHEIKSLKLSVAKLKKDV